MSAAEIIEQIKQLSPEERRKLSSLVRKLEDRSSAHERTVSPEFKRMADKVFSENKELLRRLSD